MQIGGGNGLSVIFGFGPRFESDPEALTLADDLKFLSFHFLIFRMGLFVSIFQVTEVIIPVSWRLLRHLRALQMLAKCSPNDYS